MSTSVTPKLGIRKVQDTDQFADAAFNLSLDDIDDKVLGVAHATSKAHWEVWETSTAYIIGDVIRYTALLSSQYVKCTIAGTSGAVEPTVNVLGTVFTDGTVTWTVLELSQSVSVHNDLTGRGAIGSHPQSAITNLVTDLGTITAATADKVDKVNGMGLSTNDYTTTDKGKVSNIAITQPVDLDVLETNSHTHANKIDLDKIGEDTSGNLTYNGTSVVGGAKSWTTATPYILNQLITYGGCLYKCITAHTSSAFNTDITKWSIVYANIQPWTTGVYYPLNSWMFNGTTLYLCATAHTARATFDTTELGYWAVGGTAVGISAMTYDGTASKFSVTMSNGTVNTYNGIGQNFYEGYKKTDIITAPITAVGVQALAYDITAQDFIDITVGVAEGFYKSQSIKVSDIVWTNTLSALTQNTALGSTGTIALSGTSTLTADNQVYFKIVTAPTTAGNLAGMVVGISSTLGGTYTSQTAFSSGTTATLTINGITITFTLTTGQTFIVGEIYNYTTTVDSPTTFLIDGYNGTNNYAVVVHFKGNNKLSIDSLVSSGWTITQVINACGYKGQNNNVTGLKTALLYHADTISTLPTAGNSISCTLSDSLVNYNYFIVEFALGTASNSGNTILREIKTSELASSISSAWTMGGFCVITPSVYVDAYIYSSDLKYNLSVACYSRAGVTYGGIRNVFGIVSGDGKVTMSQSQQDGRYTLTLTNVDGTSTVELPYVTLLSGNVAEIGGDNTLHITHADSSVTIGEAKEKYDTLWNGTPIGSATSTQVSGTIPLSGSLVNYRKFGLFLREIQTGGGLTWPLYKEFFVEQLSYVIANPATSELVSSVGQGTTTGYAKLVGTSTMTSLAVTCSSSWVYKIIGIY